MVTNRDALLTAAVHCLRERGPAHTSARDLVAASGTNLGAIGYHFGSKEKLINEAIMENVRNWIDELGGTIRNHAASGAGIREVLDDVFRATSTHRPLITAFLDALSHAGRSETLREQLAAHYERFRGDVAEAFQPLFDSPTMDGHQRATSSLLLALADGLIIQCLLDPANVPTSTELLTSLSLFSQLPEVSE